MDPTLGRREGVFAGIFGLGLATFLVHFFHLLIEERITQVLAGVVVPAIVSAGLMGAAIVLYSSDLESRYHPRVLGWVLGGAVSLAGLGTALMLYQMSHGVAVDDAAFVLVNWIATGGFAGMFIGYYNATLLRVRANLAAERDALAEREGALQRHNERLERLAAIVSHDLRNPLNVAEGRVELAREEGDLSHLDAVEDAHDRMGTIIDEMLALVREGQPVEEVEMTVVRLSEVAEASWQGVATEEASLSIGGDCQFEADESRLRHVFENVFRNAIEHGGRDVTVTVGTLEEETGFFVADDGQGIPPDRPVFEAGFSTDEEGTGLGLAIVEDIVVAHGWEIQTVDSGPEAGARFEIRGVDCLD